MAGGAHAGLNPRLPAHNFLAKGLGAVMWFFIFYRMRQDGHKLLGKHGFDQDHGLGHHPHGEDPAHHH